MHATIDVVEEPLKAHINTVDRYIRPKLQSGMADAIIAVDYDVM